MPTPTPLPFLPIEMKRAILSFCDAATLAKACLGSLSFLELASPFLYGDILIHRLQHFERLFYEKKPPSSAPHLDHLFSLSQLQTFTFLGVRNDSFTRYNFKITTARLPSSSPLQIKRLKVRFGRDDVVDEWGEPNEDEPNPTNLYSSKLALFDPEHVIFYSPSGGRKDQTHPFPLELELSNWTRIRTWSWSNVILQTSFDFGSPFISTLAFLPNLPGGSLEILFDIRTKKNRSPDFEETCIFEVTGDGDEEDALVSCAAVKEVVLRSSSQEQVSRICSTMEAILREGVAEDEEIKRLLQSVHFKVDE